MKNVTKGFTLIELLVVVGIIALLTTMIIPLMGGIKDDAGIKVALMEMKTIKEAVKARFYPELGLIPEDLGLDGVPDSLGDNGAFCDGDESPDGRPEYAVRFLCLRDDGDVTITWNDPNFDYTADPDTEESLEMARFLAEQLLIRLGGDGVNAAIQAEDLLQWNRHSNKGWRGPYTERERNEVFPVVLDPWGNEYRIFCGYEDDDGIYRQDKNSAQIVSYGDNGIVDCDVVEGTDNNNYVCIQEHENAVAADRPISGANWADFWALDNTQTGIAWVSGTDYESFRDDDIVMFIFGTQPTRSP